MRPRRRHAPTAPRPWRRPAWLTLGAPAGHLLSAALRGVAKAQPCVFERLGPFGQATFMIAPAGWPVAFALTPSGETGAVRIVTRDDPGPFIARIEGPLGCLLDLFEGGLDADAAFFSRTIHVEGDTGAVLALHNALEAADLGMADLLGVPHHGRALIERGYRGLRAMSRVVKPAPGR